MRKKIAAITFHASRNHGSVLQAYALQYFVTKNFGKYFDYEILNIYTDKQRVFYDKPYGYYDIKNLIKKIIFCGYRGKILKRRENYNLFLNKYLNLTERYNSGSELEKIGDKYDCYLSGSDQIWNYSLLDFDWSFFLEFARNKKISYAASFGPENIALSSETKKRIRRDLKNYDYISVRENTAADKIKEIDKDIITSVNVDPTLLLSSEDWAKLASERLYKGDYIFLYDLKVDKRASEIADKLSKKLKIPVIIVKESAKRHLFNKYIKRYDAGPSEFLSYIKNAKVVVSSSFHGNVFSIIFRKPFVAVAGKRDSRINNLLKMVHLENNAIEDVRELNCNDVFKTDFSNVDIYINKEKKKSYLYLERALGIEKNE